MNNLTMVKEFGLGTHIQALTLRSEGYSRAAIVAKTGYTPANQGPKTWVISLAKVLFWLNM